ncbi:MAG: response regulator [Candidatus Dormibacteria bacterium]
MSALWSLRGAQGTIRESSGGTGGIPAEAAAAVSVLVVEDHEMLAETLVLGLFARGFDCTVAQLTGPETVLTQAARLRPAVVLLDLQLGDTDGLDLIPGLRALGARILVVTGCTHEPRVAAALALGASGWVSKSEPFERLLEAAESVARNRPVQDRARHEEMIELGADWLETTREARRRIAQLTAREREVLWALSEGESAADIARALVVSLGTVRCHIQAILGKLDVSSQLAAVAYASSLLTSDGPPRRDGRLGGQR